ncbi:ASN_collapsed_G0051540.mRNA.1.CDS.1 [Saccharomyces cerevisiae]|nr:ASN_collapsed_G0051540.mRNA.1.CDS.1 [Saccharomyces cerevisiae]
MLILERCYFAACVSWACLPWNFYNSSSTFLTVRLFWCRNDTYYTVMICDNFLIRKRQYSVTNAFVQRANLFYQGCQLESYRCLRCGMAPGLPGIAWEVNNDYFHNTGIINFSMVILSSPFGFPFRLLGNYASSFPSKITVKHDDKDYYGAFTDERSTEEGAWFHTVEISEEEIRDYTLGECFTSGHEYKPGAADDELPEVAQTEFRKHKSV